MSWAHLADLAGAACLLAGGALSLLAGIGMLRLPDVLTRMHAATKPQTLGLLLILLGTGLRLRTVFAATTLILVGLFQTLTAPVAAHMVGRAAYRTGRADHEHIVVDELAGVPDEDDGGGSPGAHDSGGGPGDSGGGGRSPA